MALFLQVLGAFFLLMILSIVAGLLFLQFKVRGMLKQLEGAAIAMQGGMTPPRVNLQKLAAPSWENEEAVGSIADALPQLGFEPIGHFQVEEMAGLNLQGWLNAADTAYAVVYEHPIAGAWVDFVTRYEDGTAATYASTGEGRGVEHQPGFVIERFPELSVPELYRKFLAERPKKPMKTPSAATFVDEFQQAYADEMDWRNSRGGTTVEEIKAIAELTGDTYDEEIIEATREDALLNALEGLEVAIWERFLKQGTLSAADWEKVRDRAIFVHDKMPPDYLVDLVSNLADADDWEPTGAPRKAFAEFNESLEPEDRFRKIGEVREPVEADVYAGPEY